MKTNGWIIPTQMEWLDVNYSLLYQHAQDDLLDLFYDFAN